jgi:TonB family protein
MNTMPAQPPRQASVANLIRTQPLPTYPAASRRLHEEGEVVLQVQFDDQGQVQHLQRLNSSGFKRLDRSAEQAVTRWVMPNWGSQTKVVRLAFSLHDGVSMGR